MPRNEDPREALKRTRLDLAIHLLRQDGGFRDTRVSLLRRNNKAITTILTNPNYRDVLSFGDVNEAAKSIFAALHRTFKRTKRVSKMLVAAVCHEYRYCENRELPIAAIFLGIFNALRMSPFPDAAELAGYLVNTEGLLSSLCRCEAFNGYF